MDDNLSFGLGALAEMAKLERLIEAYTDANRGFGCFEHHASRSEAIEAIINGWRPDRSVVEGRECGPSGQTIYGVTICGNEAASGK